MSFEEVKEKLSVIADYRRIAKNSLFELLGISKGSLVAFDKAVSRICILASGSRGGSGVTSELLQWQGSACSRSNGRILSLPGEEKPHLILANLGYPTREQQFDDLDAADATLLNKTLLLEEIQSEIGYPLQKTTNLEVYAIQLYRRLLLQWPLPMVSLQSEDAIRKLTLELKRIYPNGYFDSLQNRCNTLAACMSCFPFIRPSFYDCWYLHDDTLISSLAADSWSIEETPFVIPPPWQNASSKDLESGTILLRDPSNAWRLPFWAEIFKNQSIRILHLTRDVRESIQGLCDGWNYEYGFQTMPMQKRIDIAGYTDNYENTNSGWKSKRLNFSIPEGLSKRLFDQGSKLSLVDVCAYQWKQAHHSIIVESSRLGLYREVINFSQLRQHAKETFKRICRSLDLEESSSGVSYANTFNDHWIMITPFAKNRGFDRWKHSVYSDDIRTLYDSGYFDVENSRLGLSHDTSSLEDQTILNQQYVNQ